MEPRRFGNGNVRRLGEFGAWTIRRRTIWRLEYSAQDHSAPGLFGAGPFGAWTIRRSSYSPVIAIALQLQQL